MPSIYPEPTPDNPLGLLPKQKKPLPNPRRRFSPFRFARRRKMGHELAETSVAGLSADTAQDVAQQVFQLVPVDVTRAFEEDGGHMQLLDGSEFAEKWHVLPSWKLASRVLRAWDTLGLMGFYDPYRNSLIAVRRSCSSKSFFSRMFMGWKTAVDIAGHELGHYVDLRCHKVSRSDVFYGIFLEERHALDTYAASDVEEFFADAFWLSCAYPEVASEYIPKAYRWFERFLEPAKTVKSC